VPVSERGPSASTRTQMCDTFNPVFHDTSV
jgi:hypothetical protein